MKRRGLPKFVSEFEDRHGKSRFRARRKGWPTVYLKSAPGTEEFWNEYRAWLNRTSHRPEVGIARTRPGSVSDLIVRWYRSAEYAGLRDSTKATYKGIVERFRSEHGRGPLALLERQHIRAIVASKARTPAAANNLLRMLRLLMRFAVEEGLILNDPTLGIKGLRITSMGFHSWSEDEIAKFEARWDRGTRARLAFDLLLYTAQRRSDVITMGRQHVRDEGDGKCIHVRQLKTDTRLAIPVHSELQATLDASPLGNMTFLVTKSGKPFTAAGFGNLFGAYVKAAAVPSNCSAHGLRKAAARRLAEAGCTAHQIAAITGHKTLKEVERYTRAAEQKQLAKSAMAKISRPKSEQKMANPTERLAKTADK